MNRRVALTLAGIVIGAGGGLVGGYIAWHEDSASKTVCRTSHAPGYYFGTPAPKKTVCRTSR